MNSRTILKGVLMALACMGTSWFPTSTQSGKGYLARTDEDKAIAEHFANYRAEAVPLSAGQIVGVGPVHAPLPTPGPPPSDFDLLRDAVCGSDVVAIGSLGTPRVIFTPDKTFLLSLHQFRSERIIRPAGAHDLSEATVALPGGEVILDGRRTVAISPVEIPIEKPIVMLLRRLPKTKAYTVATRVGAVIFEGSRTRSALPTRLTMFSREETLHNFTASLVNATASCIGR